MDTLKYFEVMVNGATGKKTYSFKDRKDAMASIRKGYSNVPGALIYEDELMNVWVYRNKTQYQEREPEVWGMYKETPKLIERPIDLV